MTTPTIDAPAPYTHIRGKALALLAVLCGTYFLDALDVSMLAVAIPQVGADLGMTATLPWIVAGYVLGFGGFLLFGGRAADLLGRRRVFLIALAAFVLMSALGGFAWNGEVLIATRFFKGIAAAFTAPAALSLVATSFQEGSARNRALSFYTATGSAGFTFGLIFGGLLTEWDWRAVFFMPAIIGAITFVAGFWAIPAQARAARGVRLDVPGAVLITAAMMSIVYALTLGPEQGWGNIATWAPLVLGALLVVAFILVERRHPNPLLPPHVLTSWPRVRANLAVFALVGGWGASQFLLTLHFQETLEWSPLMTAAAFWPCGVLGLFVAPFMGRLISRFTLLGVMAFGLLLTVIAYGLLQFVELGSMYWVTFFPAFALIGIAFTLIFSTGAIGATSGLPQDEQGLAGGVLQSASQFGVAVLLAITTAVYRGNLPADPSSEQQLSAYEAGWIVPLAASALALIVVAISVRPQKSTREPRRGKEHRMSKSLNNDELPAAVHGFVDGWQGRDGEKVVALFADDAVVSDEGKTHRGIAEIRGWVDGSINLFTTTLTFLGAREVEGMVGSSYRLEGDFPGGVVDLEYQFHLDDDGKIAQLDFAASAA